jgi:pSer/pThr/pTyr-binding forkhead associated (FHA) protein
MLAAAPAAQRLHLVVVSGAESVSHVLPPEGELRIGRSTDCEIHVEDETLSRHHATLRVTKDGLSIVDLGSANGTFFENRRLEEGAVTAVSLGSVIVFAGVTATIQRAAVSARRRVLRTHEYFMTRLEE